MNKRTSIGLSCAAIAAMVLAPVVSAEEHSAVSAEPVFTRAPWNPPNHAVSGDGEALYAVLRTNEAVLYSTEPDGLPRGVSAGQQVSWYLVTHTFSSDPKAYEKQLEHSIFEEPPRPGHFPFPSEPIHLGNSPVDTASTDDGKTLLMFTPDDDQNGGIQPRRARGVYAYIGRRDKAPQWFCLTPALWWGDGLTEAQVQAGCKSTTPSEGWGWNFHVVCDGSGATIPECVRLHGKKSAAPKPPAP